MCEGSKTSSPEGKPSREKLLEGLLRATGSSESTAQRPAAIQLDEDRGGEEMSSGLSMDASPLAGGGGGDEDLEDRVEDAGDYADDICIRGEGETGGGGGGGMSGEGVEGAASAGAFYEVLSVHLAMPCHIVSYHTTPAHVILCRDVVCVARLLRTTPWSAPMTSYRCSLSSL